MASQGRSRIAIAGGGVAGLEAAIALLELAPEPVEIELLSPQRDLVIRPPLGGPPLARFDLGRLAAELGAGYRGDAVTAVEPERRSIETRLGERLPYDFLILAPGSVRRRAVAGAETYWGPEPGDGLATLLAELPAEGPARAGFLVPPGAGWPPVAYELALTAARELESRARSAELAVVTPEEQPLEGLGEEASRTAAGLLAGAGIEFVGGSYPVELRGGRLFTLPAGSLRLDRALALPMQSGPRIEGVPRGAEGFIAVDEHCRVLGLERVYAAGDATAFPHKHGAAAALQAHAAAEHLAATLGAPLEPRQFDPARAALVPAANGLPWAAGENVPGPLLRRYVRSRLGREPAGSERDSRAATGLREPLLDAT